MRFVIKIDTDNHAFSEGCHAEVSRILRDLADRLGDYPDGTYGQGVLRDYNGNKVGTAEHIEV